MSAVTARPRGYWLGLGLGITGMLAAFGWLINSWAWPHYVGFFVFGGLGLFALVSTTQAGRSPDPAHARSLIVRALVAGAVAILPIVGALVYLAVLLVKLSSSHAFH